ncbi:hypothetical protein [Bacillus cereus]|uniref:Uncharacterized protein n=1 Tax=Bacillus cereus TaxID=1396 RepID=A0A161R5Y1_BACCE|nr:hypothetical protein [Bacillus cereus]KZD71164.1 hypothetical protein B4088_0894 [Bacillus cereus]
MANIRRLIVAMNYLEEISPLIDVNDITLRVSRDITSDGFILSRSYMHDSEAVFDTKSFKVFDESKKKSISTEYDFVVEIDVPIDERLHIDDPFFHYYHVSKETFGIYVIDKPRNYTNINIVEQQNVKIRSYHIKRKENKVFIADFEGKKVLGKGVVVAPNKDIAYNMFKEELEKKGLINGFTKNDIHQLDIDKKHVQMLFNMNY